MVKRLLRQDLVGGIELSGHDVYVDTDAKFGDEVVEAADGRHGGRVLVLDQVPGLVGRVFVASHLAHAVAGQDDSLDAGIEALQMKWEQFDLSSLNLIVDKSQKSDSDLQLHIFISVYAQPVPLIFRNKCIKRADLASSLY